MYKINTVYQENSPEYDTQVEINDKMRHFEKKGNENSKISTKENEKSQNFKILSKSRIHSIWYQKEKASSMYQDTLDLYQKLFG